MATLHLGGYSPSSILLLLLLLVVVSSSASPVHEMLTKYGFPPGIFPDAAKNYTLSSDGRFVIELDYQCYLKLDYNVYYEKKIRGKLEFRHISQVSGILTNRFRYYSSITDFVVYPSNDYILFFAPSSSVTYPVKRFQEIPSCKALLRHSGRGTESLTISEV